jgi:signal transduction histidine kinase
VLSGHEWGDLLRRQQWVQRIRSRERSGFWFRASCAGLFLALLAGAYQLRMRQVQHTFDMTLEARVGERTRIARELHDTLLQSFHGLLLRFQTASYLLPERPPGSHLSVAVEGQARDLHPMLRDEIYKIAAEALRNAFRHAHAERIEVEMHYDDEQFRLRVRDNGRRIDTAPVASHATAGHFGLRGMTERTALLGGKLAVWSEVDGGTELELRLPANIVCVTFAKRSWWSRLLTKTPARAEGDAS